jgi:DNA-directed RNA polymerase subunit RPC12/RpoP
MDTAAVPTGLKNMDIRFECHSCSQSIEVNAEGAGQEFRCPSCGTRLTVPTVITSIPKAPPKYDAPQYRYIPPAPQQSVASGVFKGLFAFFILLPLGIIAALVLFAIVSSMCH